MTRVESAGPISTLTHAPAGGAVPTLIVPGLFGSGEVHWQRVWHEDRLQTRMLRQTDWEHPDLETWLAVMEAVVEAGGETYIIAHSLGCMLTARQQTSSRLSLSDPPWTGNRGTAPDSRRPSVPARLP
ncbi:RBBP9/YdeN family alpha/beta hydrolase [Rhizobium sp. 9140]|uniref:RBBP9/YdeN family alpha/beta hydrolase n=1 Tax=Rhizobium sp. 9140 TaxID=1761900 RepID=UPI000795DB52|nr:alpha/beta hydrolase [Rhizobium sp. 9140]CZT36090.1 Serine hydrolase [Rhizobium sp. 9140]